MATKHMFDNSQGLVERNLRGTVAQNPALRYYAQHKVVYNPAHDNKKVAVISGGGAGHEPGQGGFVGEGMLAAAISGDIFASPSAAQICSGIDLINHDAGVVMVVNNYTGDCLHFGLAAEKARAAIAYSGKQGGGVEAVIVADDVAVGRKRGGLVGRRGLAGNIFTCKILGAASDKGFELKKIGELGRTLMDNMVSIGTSLDHCHVPGRPKGDEERGALAPEAAELGMGIHNEPGFKHMDKKPEPEALLGEMLDLLLNPDDEDRAYTPFDKEDAPVVFINNLGGMSQLEMNAIVDLTIELLESKWNLHPSRVLCGSYMTSLNAPGFGVSLINHKRFEKTTGESLLELLDHPTTAASWVGVQSGWGSSSGHPRDRKAEEKEADDHLQSVRKAGGSVSGLADPGSSSGGPSNPDPELVKKAILAACDATVEVEPTLTRYDTIVGDGDCGETLAQAGNAVKKALQEGEIPIDNAAGTLIAIGEVLEYAMGGTSGAIYALFFAGLVQSLLSNPKGSQADVKVWGKAALDALENLGRYTPARPGDRTLVDALDPFCRSLGAGKSLAEAVEASKKGAESTVKMTPRLGRATYVGSKDDGDMPPDPGAWGIWALTDGLRKGLGQ
ncbi:DhaL domain protein [Kalmanozyma brasiliensis GHG001]|uniref:Putative DAK2-dihydroxyacetone kinase n=1 Tax=Kalmanozyma brasiliensis (strain GHG001) TaxID=1365824 RepID=V5EW39_KALBG|nr:DhaL domain protein [Kalmanozyma brasiliensis GHG001]EST09740.1 DhaL domain protein [Kalmanozyma brasiliensis GHG001]